MTSIQGIKLIIINETPMTTSREIALHFEKQHKVVLHKIENLDCSPPFNQHHFMPVTYQDSKSHNWTPIIILAVCNFQTANGIVGGTK